MTYEDLELFRAALARPGVPSSDFDLNPDFALPNGKSLRPAAVLAPIIQSNSGLRLLLTKRSSVLKHHPGQIAFPGGKQDSGDSNLISAALREAHEEIGLPPTSVEILGTLPTHETVTGFVVTPVIGFITKPFEPRPEPGEVDEIFSIPLSHVMDAKNFQVQSRHWRGQLRSYFAVPFGPYYIWGATARMLRAWTEQMTSEFLSRHPG